MTNAVVYSSVTGNTKLLAETIKNQISRESLLYFGPPQEEALKADRIYVGFWTDKGGCDRQTAQFLKTITTQEVYLFGTAGFGENAEYYERILKHTMKHIPKSASILGTFMCQGKMPLTVRQRYEKMQKSPFKIHNVQGMIENFDRALEHPNREDLNMLRKQFFLSDGGSHIHWMR